MKSKTWGFGRCENPFLRWKSQFPKFSFSGLQQKVSSSNCFRQVAAGDVSAINRKGERFGQASPRSQNFYRFILFIIIGRFWGWKCTVPKTNSSHLKITVSCFLRLPWWVFDKFCQHRNHIFHLLTRFLYPPHLTGTDSSGNPSELTGWSAQTKHLAGGWGNMWI